MVAKMVAASKSPSSRITSAILYLISPPPPPTLLLLLPSAESPPPLKPDCWRLFFSNCWNSSHCDCMAFLSAGVLTPARRNMASSFCSSMVPNLESPVKISPKSYSSSESSLLKNAVFGGGGIGRVDLILSFWSSKDDTANGSCDDEDDSVSLVDSSTGRRDDDVSQAAYNKSLSSPFENSLVEDANRLVVSTEPSFLTSRTSSSSSSSSNVDSSTSK